MISIGFQSKDLYGSLPTIIDNQGILCFKGQNVRIGRGSTIKVTQTGKVEFMADVRIGAKNLIISEEYIVFGKGSTFSWDCQIMDTDIHSIDYRMTNEIRIIV